jgi:hypothetical protein
LKSVHFRSLSCNTNIALHMFWMWFLLSLLKIVFFKFQSLQAQNVKYAILQSVYDYWKEKVCDLTISLEGYASFVYLFDFLDLFQYMRAGNCTRAWCVCVCVCVINIQYSHDKMWI